MDIKKTEHKFYVLLPVLPKNIIVEIVNLP